MLWAIPPIICPSEARRSFSTSKSWFSRIVFISSICWVISLKRIRIPKKFPLFVILLISILKCLFKFSKYFSKANVSEECFALSKVNTNSSIFVLVGSNNLVNSLLRTSFALKWNVFKKVWLKSVITFFSFKIR